MAKIMTVDGDVLDISDDELVAMGLGQTGEPVPALSDYVSSIAAMMDAKAKERRYDNALSIATYVGSGNVAWAAEAQAFMTWRDQIWEYCYAELDKVQNGEREQPTIGDFLTELEAQFPLSWPA
ncbi:hypothetical protein [Rhizobium rhizogenes]|uniref:hypothetical protein n=1 Tax=Rhizobium rhizogenes TaxID=359 RepID=UPI0024BDA1AF|nr:hypothetical protein [Rhizobium rhizogenes]MDJ1632666.1 hypothetical protein [Rhizobium rhizogenes]